LLSVVVVLLPVETVAPTSACPSDALVMRPLIEAAAPDESWIFSVVVCPVLMVALAEPEPIPAALAVTA
jgi:hypothetical protein